MKEKEITFSVPRDMKSEEIAQTFSAYILGPRAFQNQDMRFGPFERPVPGSWTLDVKRRFMLRVSDEDGGKATISCQNSLAVPQMEALVVLFQAMHADRMDY